MLIITIICVFLFVLFGTRNGRKLVIKAIRNRLNKTPLSAIRANNARGILSTPHIVSKTILDIITHPIDSDNNWVRFIKQDTWEGCWIDASIKNFKHAEDKDLVILYIHGGAFALGNALMYLETYQLIINSLKEKHDIDASILTVNYSLSREHKWPRATNQCFEAYKYLLHEAGISPNKIILIGDSAGGNLVCTTLLKIQEYKSTSTMNQLPPLSIPAGAVLLSPWLDLSVDEYPDSSRDILHERLLSESISVYIPDWNTLNKEQKLSIARNPFISPLYGDYSQIKCPFFISVGEYEILLPEIEAFISKLKDTHHNVTEFFGEKQTHVWFGSPITSDSYEVFKQDSQVYIQWVSDIVKK